MAQLGVQADAVAIQIGDVGKVAITDCP